MTTWILNKVIKDPKEVLALSSDDNSTFGAYIYKKQCLFNTDYVSKCSHYLFHSKPHAFVMTKDYQTTAGFSDTDTLASCPSATSHPFWKGPFGMSQIKYHIWEISLMWKCL